MGMWGWLVGGFGGVPELLGIAEPNLGLLFAPAPKPTCASHLWEFDRSRRPGAAAAYCSCFPSKTKGPCSRRERVAWPGVCLLCLLLGG